MSVRKHLLTAGAATAAACLLIASAARGSARSAAPTPDKLGKADRALLAQARVNGDANVTLLLAAVDGQTADAVAALEAAGATVQYRNDDLGYLRVEIAVDSAEAVNSIDSVQSADVDQIVPLPSPEPDASQPAQPQVPPGPRDAEGQPVHADRRDGLRSVARGAPDVGRPRDHDRHRRHGRRPAPSGARDDEHGRAEDHRLGRRDGPGHRQRPDVAREHDGRQRQGREVHGRRSHLHGAHDPGHFFWSQFNERDAASPGASTATTSTATATPPARAASSASSATATRSGSTPTRT